MQSQKTRYKSFLGNLFSSFYLSLLIYVTSFLVRKCYSKYNGYCSAFPILITSRSFFQKSDSSSVLDKYKIMKSLFRSMSPRKDLFTLQVTQSHVTRLPVPRSFRCVSVNHRRHHVKHFVEHAQLVVFKESQ